MEPISSCEACLSSHCSRCSALSLSPITLTPAQAPHTNHPLQQKNSSSANAANHMLSAHAHKAAAATTTKTAAVSRAAKVLPAAARLPVRVRVSTEEASPEKSAPAVPPVDFTPNTQAASGYVAFDTAGQENMYPVMTKAYEVGSDQDTLETSSANLVVGVGAGFIAAAVLVVGLAALSQQGGAGASDATLEGLKSLTEYAAAFSADL